MPTPKPDDARASVAGRKMAISDALATLAVGQGHASYAYEPTTDHLERAAQILRTEKTVVVSDKF